MFLFVFVFVSVVFNLNVSKVTPFCPIPFHDCLVFLDIQSILRASFEDYGLMFWRVDDLVDKVVVVEHVVRSRLGSDLRSTEFVSGGSVSAAESAGGGMGPFWLTAGGSGR